MIKQKYMEDTKMKMDNSPISIDNVDVVSRILKAYKLLIEDGKSLYEIAEILHTAEFTIFCDLTKRLPLLNITKPEIVSKEMVENIKNVLALEEKESINIPLNAPFKLLFKMYPSRDKRLKFMEKCIINFGLRLDDLSFILSEDKEILFKEYSNSEKYNIQILDTIFRHGYKTSEEAMQSFEAYFQRLSKAYIAKDKDDCKKILEELNKIDKDANEFIKNHKIGLPITDEELLIILRYQLKYWLSVTRTAKIFSLSQYNYCRRIAKLENLYPDLIKQYYFITDYFLQKERTK